VIARQKQVVYNHKGCTRNYYGMSSTFG